MSRKYFTAKDRLRQKEARAKGEVYRPGGASLSLSDVAAVIRMTQDGKTQTELAKFFGVNQSTISRVLTDFDDTRLLAKHRLNAAADDLAKTAVRAAEKASQHGDGSVALELLDRLEVAPKRQDASGGGARVMVVVGATGPQALAALPAGLLAQPVADR